MDLTGMTFGNLTVVGRDDNNTKTGTYWMCICKCQSKERVPKQRPIREDKLLEGRTLSCGCNKLLQTTRRHSNTNTFDLSLNDRVLGYTAKNEIFYFDKEDYDLVISVSTSWAFNDGGYLAARDMRDGAAKYSNGRRKYVYLKDIIMSKQDGEQVEYIDKQNKHDNTKSNLLKREVKNNE